MKFMSSSGLEASEQEIEDAMAEDAEDAEDADQENATSEL